MVLLRIHFDKKIPDTSQVVKGAFKEAWGTDEWNRGN